MERDAKPKKSLGQNFLADPKIVDRIIANVRPKAGDTIVEIGPGRGALTDKLIQSGGRIFAVELDGSLAAFLRDKYSGSNNFEVVEADALTIDFNELSRSKGENVRIVANLPYYISTAILQRLIESRCSFTDLTLMFQREVVERITAPAGSSERGFLTVLVEAYMESRKLFDVPPNAFYPVPKVYSAVVSMIPKEDAGPPIAEFRRLLAAAFAQKRKTILNNLKQQYQNSRELLEIAQVDGCLRAESLKLNEWQRLFDVINRAA